MASSNELARSQRSSNSGGGGDRDDAVDASSSRPTTPTTNEEDTQSNILLDYELIDTFLAEVGASDAVQDALNRITCLAQHVASVPTTLQNIQSLQQTVQKLADRIETQSKRASDSQSTAGLSYAAVASGGALKPTFLPTPQHKHIPTRYKREIIVRGSETTSQKNRSYKELIEQLNGSDGSWAKAKAKDKAKARTSEAAAIRQLPSGDIVLTMEDEKARTT